MEMYDVQTKFRDYVLYVGKFEGPLITIIFYNKMVISSWL